MYGIKISPAKNPVKIGWILPVIPRILWTEDIYNVNKFLFSKKK
jgi:hypothetical protein